MTVKIISATQNFQGPSTEMSTVTAPEGSGYHAIDTGEEFVRHNGGWEKDYRKARAIKDAELLPQL